MFPIDNVIMVNISMDHIRKWIWLWSGVIPIRHGRCVSYAMKYSTTLPVIITKRPYTQLGTYCYLQIYIHHNDVIKWKHFPGYWPFVRGIQRSPVNSPHKGQWRGAWMLSLICAWMNGWVNNREAGDFRRHRAHYDVTVMCVWYAMKYDTKRPMAIAKRPYAHLGTRCYLWLCIHHVSTWFTCIFPDWFASEATLANTGI